MPTLVTDHEATPGTLPHTLEVDRGIAVRLYLWVYFASTRRINTCKMFWAFVFMPLALPISALIHGLSSAAHWIDRQFPENPNKPMAPPKPPRVGPSKGEKFLEAVSGFLAKAWFKIQPLLKWGGILIGALIALLLIYLVVTNFSAVVTGLLTVLVAGLIIVAIAAVLMGILFVVIEKTSIGDRIGGFFRLMGKLGRSVHDHTCANVKIKD